jgi:CRP/FNR family transcriptional regulator, cyclic AMP receptor protein
MSPDSQLSASPRVRKIAGPGTIGPTLQKRNAMSVIAAKKKPNFDPNAFLGTISEGRKLLLFPKKQRIYAQGDSADAVLYVQTGKVKLSVVSTTGREATIGILGAGEFFGEGSLAGQALRMGSATAMTDCAVLRIEKKAMMAALHREHLFSDMFVAYLLARNIRYEEDLVDQLFNSSEKRLARVLLLLAHFGKEGKQEVAIPKISQETLAEMVGTTRSRVSFFMNRFRELGFIDYHAGDALQIHSSLLNIVLHD